jgi:hypothetical protein
MNCFKRCLLHWLKISVTQGTLLWNKQCNTLSQLHMQHLIRIRKSCYTNYFYKVKFDTPIFLYHSEDKALLQLQVSNV